MSPLISAVGLRRSFGRALVLDDVSLEIDAGSCLALLGPNGAGKTTLLRILATLLRPSAGRLVVCGVDALAQPDRARASLGVVAHGSYVYEDLSARENLRFWTVMGGYDAGNARIESALAQVDLDGVADDRVRTFSVGMKRRLSLARVLLGRARALLLDEPFTGLDQRGRKWLTEFLLAFKAGGGAVVVATHSLATGLGAADRVAILAGGRVMVDLPSAGLGADAIRRLYEDVTDGDEAPA